MTPSQKAKTDHGRPPTVHVTINGDPFQVPPGRVEVPRLKKLAGVPAADELAELKDGKVVPLPDDGFADTEQCDVFTSYPRSCASS